LASFDHSSDDVIACVAYAESSVVGYDSKLTNSQTSRRGFSFFRDGGRRGTPTDVWQASGFLSMSMETLQRVYGHHHPDYQREAAENIGKRPQNVRVIRGHF
jgi:hypothetical protein